MELCAVSPAKPWEVVAITFTNKAARELQDRLTRAVGEADASAIWAYTFHTAVFVFCVVILSVWATTVPLPSMMKMTKTCYHRFDSPVKTGRENL
ncbi:MAG: UvrD-helicase domain-containing protein [Butyricicoccus pullicaecorum]